VIAERARAERFAELFRAVYLTFHRRDALRRDREVLGTDLLARAMSRLPPAQADGLITGLQALVDLAAPAPAPPERSKGETS
jgi:hypothetical protein